jgi:hypothetical protein
MLAGIGIDDVLRMVLRDGLTAMSVGVALGLDAFKDPPSGR